MRAAELEEERKESNIKRERELHKEIDAFMRDPSHKTKSFPNNLNSWERQVVHAYCEVLKIKHESKGEGMARHIVISKPDLLIMPPAPMENVLD